jgi:membrane fusion protein (multidrug efflux system)
LAPQLVVPGKAVVEQMGEYFVFVAKDTVINDPNAKVKSDSVKKPRLLAIQKKVQVGQTLGPNQIIKGGVKAGDRIVVDGVQTLHDGSPITTANKVPAGGGGRGGRGQ